MTLSPYQVDALLRAYFTEKRKKKLLKKFQGLKM